MLSKSEFIAEYEKVPAYFAILHHLNSLPKLPAIVTPIQLKREMEAEMGCRVTASSIEKALLYEETEDLQLADKISGSGNSSNFKINSKAFNEIYLPYANVERNLVWRLRNIGTGELKSDLSAARAQAERDFARRGRDGKAALATDPTTMMSFDGIYGLLQHAQTPFHKRIRTKSRSTGQGLDWGKWGAIAGITAIPLAVILWWFS